GGVLRRGARENPKGKRPYPQNKKPANDQQSKAVVVEWSGQKLDLVVLGEFQSKNFHPRHAHAAVAAGDVVELEQERVKQHAEGEREHSEKNPDIAHAEQSNR